MSNDNIKIAHIHTHRCYVLYLSTHVVDNIMYSHICTYSKQSTYIFIIQYKAYSSSTKYFHSHQLHSLAVKSASETNY